MSKMKPKIPTYYLYKTEGSWMIKAAKKIN